MAGSRSMPSSSGPGCSEDIAPKRFSAMKSFSPTNRDKIFASWFWRRDLSWFRHMYKTFHEGLDSMYRIRYFPEPTMAKLANWCGACPGGATCNLLGSLIVSGGNRSTGVDGAQDCSKMT